MSFRSSVTIVASPRPRVGKTLLARLLTDFHRHEGRRVAAFDLNGGEDTLARYLPMQASAASVADVRGEMALFDRLIADDGVSKVVDLGAESFATFFSVAAKIGFAEEARRRAVAPAVLFVMTPDRTAVEAYRHLHGRFPAVMLMPVHNEILGPAHHPGKYLFVGSGAQVVQLPALAPKLHKYIEVPPLSLADAQFGDRHGVPPGAQAELQRWLRRVFLEFRELELRILLADLQSSFKFGPH
jgi:hypothetical protein